MNGKHCSKYRCVCIAIEYGEAQSACPDFIRKDNKKQETMKKSQNRHQCRHYVDKRCHIDGRPCLLLLDLYDQCSAFSKRKITDKS